MKTRPIETVSASRNRRGNEARTLKKSEPPSAFAKLRCDKHVGCHGFERGSIELSIATSAGQFVARYSGKGLAELDFPANGRAELPLGQNAQQRVPTPIRRWHQATVAALKNILAGRSPKKFPPLDLSNGTTFRRKVWNTLRKIARGQTKSYGQIARAVCKPKAVRAVGGACGANPIPVFVPCHRVLAANKKLGGFSGGLNWKRKLLTREGVIFR
jgi:O-6-methylguanine DNA methyltransferase